MQLCDSTLCLLPVLFPSNGLSKCVVRMQLKVELYGNLDVCCLPESRFSVYSSNNINNIMFRNIFSSLILYCDNSRLRINKSETYMRKIFP